MKSKSKLKRVRQILNAVSALLLLASLVLTIWLDRRKEAVRDHNEDLAAATVRIRYDILQMSDGMRGMLLAPDSAVERKRKFDADEDVAKAVTEMKAALDGYPLVSQALSAIGEFDNQNLNVKENHVIELLATDHIAAAE